MILLFVRIANRELCSSGIISISFSDCKLAIKHKHVLLAVNQFFDVCSSQKWTL
jgi:hypothetical protein